MGLKSIRIFTVQDLREPRDDKIYLCLWIYASELSNRLCTYVLKGFCLHREPKLNIVSTAVEIVVDCGAYLPFLRFEHCFGDFGIIESLIWSDQLPASPTESGVQNSPIFTNWLRAEWIKPTESLRTVPGPSHFITWNSSYCTEEGC
jgi:hypothetical protein